jgi:hypothetical protein
MGTSSIPIAGSMAPGTFAGSSNPALMPGQMIPSQYYGGQMLPTVGQALLNNGLFANSMIPGYLVPATNPMPNPLAGVPAWQYIPTGPGPTGPAVPSNYTKPQPNQFNWGNDKSGPIEQPMLGKSGIIPAQFNWGAPAVTTTPAPKVTTSPKVTVAPKVISPPKATVAPKVTKGVK